MVARFASGWPSSSMAAAAPERAARDTLEARIKGKVQKMLLHVEDDEDDEDDIDTDTKRRRDEAAAAELAAAVDGVHGARGSRR